MKILKSVVILVLMIILFSIEGCFTPFSMQDGTKIVQGDFTNTNLYAVCSNSISIFKKTKQNQDTFLRKVWFDSNTISNPTDVAVSSTNRLFVANGLNGHISFFNDVENLTGAVSVPTGEIVNSEIIQPSALCLDKVNNRLYVADHVSSTVSIYTQSDKLSGTVTAPCENVLSGDGVLQPVSMLLDTEDNLIVSGSESVSVIPAISTLLGKKDTGDLQVSIINIQPVQNIQSVCLDPDNHLFIADESNDRIAVFSSQDEITAGNPGFIIDQGLTNPVAIFADDQHRLFCVDDYTRIVIYTDLDKIETVSGFVAQPALVIDENTVFQPKSLFVYNDCLYVVNDNGTIAIFNNISSQITVKQAVVTQTLKTT